MEYEYDVFVSYRRRGNIQYWVRSVLVPELEGCLDSYLYNNVRIAVDERIVETGDPWPEKLSKAHAQSKTFVVVLSANYFRSGWCMSEWRNAIERQALLKDAAIDHEPLVIPVCFNDLDDEELKALPAQLGDEVRGIERDVAVHFVALARLASCGRRGDGVDERIRELGGVGAWWPQSGSWRPRSNGFAKRIRN